MSANTAVAPLAGVFDSIAHVSSGSSEDDAESIFHAPRAPPTTAGGPRGVCPRTRSYVAHAATRDPLPTRAGPHPEPLLSTTTHPTADDAGLRAPFHALRAEGGVLLRVEDSGLDTGGEAQESTNTPRTPQEPVVGRCGGTIACPLAVLGLCHHPTHRVSDVSLCGDGSCAEHFALLATFLRELHASHRVVLAEVESLHRRCDAQQRRLARLERAVPDDEVGGRVRVAGRPLYRTAPREGVEHHSRSPSPRRSRSGGGVGRCGSSPMPDPLSAKRLPEERMQCRTHSPNDTDARSSCAEDTGQPSAPHPVAATGYEGEESVLAPRKGEGAASWREHRHPRPLWAKQLPPPTCGPSSTEGSTLREDDPDDDAVAGPTSRRAPRSDLRAPAALPPTRHPGGGGLCQEDEQGRDDDLDGCTAEDSPALPSHPDRRRRRHVSCFESYEARQASVSTISSASSDYADAEDLEGGPGGGVVRQLQGLIAAAAVEGAESRGSERCGEGPALDPQRRSSHCHGGGGGRASSSPVHGGAGLGETPEGGAELWNGRAPPTRAPLSPPSAPSLMSNTRRPSQWTAPTTRTAAAAAGAAREGPHVLVSITDGRYTAPLPRLPGGPGSSRRGGGGLSEDGGSTHTVGGHGETVTGTAAPTTTTTAAAAAAAAWPSMMVPLPMQRPTLVRRPYAPDGGTSPTHRRPMKPLSANLVAAGAAGVGRGKSGGDGRVAGVGRDAHAMSAITEGAGRGGPHAERAGVSEGREGATFAGAPRLASQYYSEGNLRSLQQRPAQ